VLYVSTASRTRLSLDGLHISNTSSTSILIQNAETVDVLSCVIDGSGGNGVYIDGYSDTFAGQIDGNTILRPALGGLYLAGLRDGKVSRNIVRNPGVNSDGLRLTGSLPGSGGNLVELNSVYIDPGGPSGVTGLSIDGACDHNWIRKNGVKGATTRGFLLSSSENRAEENMAILNAGDGFSISGSRNHLDDNLSTENSSCGIAFLNTNAHAWSNNMLRGNAAGSEVCNGGAPNTNAGGNICDAGFCP
jgi:parallel beta helix pectate lyase-like protein/copper-binding protein NosD